MTLGDGIHVLQFLLCVLLDPLFFFVLSQTLFTQRYESEYSTHYKKFDARRPYTVKGEVTRSLSYSDSNGSTPRAGLQSSKLGTIHEPPLQRKRIVPYEKNHNIFTTFTVKEQADREWLRSDRESYRSRTPPGRRHREVKGNFCSQYYYTRTCQWKKWVVNFMTC